ncbi:MAG: M20/M25/M40 family metallo-hydrolase [Terriglobales bacterium]
MRLIIATTALAAGLLSAGFLLRPTPLTRPQAPAAAAVMTQVEVEARARELEAPESSKIMWIMHELADVYGPRLTGDPNLVRADSWVMRTTTSWGMRNAHLEPYPFVPERLHHTVPGWANLLLQANAIKPFQNQLVVRPLHWTPGTHGPVTALAVLIPDPPGMSRGSFSNGQFVPAPRPTQADLDAYFAKDAPVVHGKIVLVGEYSIVPVDFKPPALRYSDTEWNCRVGVLASGSDACKPFQRRRFFRPPAQAPEPGTLDYRAVSEQLDAFLLKNGVEVRINDAHKAHGVIVAYNNPSYDVSTAVPTVVMQSDSYGRIARLLADTIPVTLRFNIENTTYPAGHHFNDVVAEIPGTDLKDEVVMLGGHLDSWNNATGATDNAAGSAMMLEAARILLAMHAHPRRTIRVALWGGEEEGLLGSLAYVDAHFGSVEHPKPEFKNLVAYLNIDDGTSKPRAASVFGPPAAAEFFRQTLAPFHDWGFMGATASTSRRTGGTDSTSFNQAGLPGVNFEQDPIEYQPYSWHTNLDTYERLVPEDLREGAAEIASMAYALADAPDMLPRFNPASMPKPPNPIDPSPQAALKQGGN